LNGPNQLLFYTDYVNILSKNKRNTEAFFKTSRYIDLEVCGCVLALECRTKS